MCYPEIPVIRPGMKLPADYLSRSGYRLPTEAEFEYACRTGTATSRYYGQTDALLGNYAWYPETADTRSCPVGTLKPNDLGLFDTHGNVYEWCQERFRNYQLASRGMASRDIEDEVALSDNGRRVLRGGAYTLHAQLVREGELRERAEAAWHLGNLGSTAKPALPELIAVIQDDDETVSRAAAFRPISRIPRGGFRSFGHVSLKDAAIRAVAEIGDASVEAPLTSEWERRSTEEPTRTTAAWNRNSQAHQVARSYEAKWVADAIEQLIGMRPIRRRSDESEFTTWVIDNLSIAKIYRNVFSHQQTSLHGTLDMAVRLMPRAHELDRSSARVYIESSVKVPKPEELELQIKLIELLSDADGPRLVLEPMLRRWFHYYSRIGAKQWKPGEQDAVVRAYEESALRIVRGSEDWRTSLVPHLDHLAQERLWPASVVLTDLLSELSPDQQSATVVQLLRLMSVVSQRNFASCLGKLETWLQNDSHRATVHQLLQRDNGDPWEDLMVGLMRSGLADQAASEILESRFGADSINRGDLLNKLIASLDDRPSLAEVIVELIEHPALDSSADFRVGRDGKRTTITSLRAKVYLPVLMSLKPRHRPKFRPLLERLATSGKHGEQRSAQVILNKWK